MNVVFGFLDCTWILPFLVVFGFHADFTCYSSKL